VPRRLATIDLGTNTVRLLVVQADGLDWRTLHHAQQVTRLGEGQAGAGRLLDHPVRRTLDTVVEFIAAARRLGALEVHVVATSAVREAPNRDDLLARLRARTGGEVRVVTGEEEARLTLSGVAAALPELNGSFMLVDIGGGSTEFALARNGRATRAVSVRLGVVQLCEQFMDGGPVDPARFTRMQRLIEERLAADLPSEIAAVSSAALVGTAGTVTTLAALDLGLPAYDPDRVHRHVLRRAAVDRLLAGLGAMTVAERAKIPCIEPGRADVLVPGMAICLAILTTLARESLVVSDQGLREGIVREILSGT
jgi:exopolyphosphatase / guanosine-5'-triphosphate,3'-diphosphate pyrophosphatase